MKRFKTKNMSFGSLILIGAAICLVMLIPVSLILTVISSFLKNPTSATGIISLVCVLISAALSGLVIARISDEGRLPVSALSAVIAVSVMTVIGLLCKGGITTAGVFLNHSAYVALTVISAYFGRPRRKKRKYR